MRMCYVHVSWTAERRIGPAQCLVFRHEDEAGGRSGLIASSSWWASKFDLYESGRGIAYIQYIRRIRVAHPKKSCSQDGNMSLVVFLFGSRTHLLQLLSIVVLRPTVNAVAASYTIEHSLIAYNAERD